MTTKFLDNKICTLKILLSWRFPTKTSIFGQFPSLPPRPPPPLKSENFIFIVVSPALNYQPSSHLDPKPPIPQWEISRLVSNVSHFNQYETLGSDTALEDPPFPRVFLRVFLISLLF